LDKKTTKLFLNFCPEIFCTFLGASRKLFGGNGFNTEYPVEKLMRDAKIYQVKKLAIYLISN